MSTNEQHVYKALLKIATGIGLLFIRVDDFVENNGYCTYFLIDNKENLIFQSDFLQNISIFIEGYRTGLLTSMLDENS